MTEGEFRDWLEGPFGAQPVGHRGKYRIFEIHRGDEDDTSTSTIYVPDDLDTSAKRDDFKRYLEAHHRYPED